MVAHTLARAANFWASFHRFEIILLCIERLLTNEIHYICLTKKSINIYVFCVSNYFL
jgi:hypothetical protein